MTHEEYLKLKEEQEGRVLENKFMDYIVLKQADPLNAYDNIVVDSKNTFQIKAQQFPKP